jgi:hypothetical protein
MFKALVLLPLLASLISPSSAAPTSVGRIARPRTEVVHQKRVTHPNAITHDAPFSLTQTVLDSVPLNCPYPYKSGQKVRCYPPDLQIRLLTSHLSLTRFRPSYLSTARPVRETRVSPKVSVSPSTQQSKLRQPVVSPGISGWLIVTLVSSPASTSVTRTYRTGHSRTHRSPASSSSTSSVSFTLRWVIRLSPSSVTHR